MVGLAQSTGNPARVIYLDHGGQSFFVTESLYVCRTREDMPDISGTVEVVITAETDHFSRRIRTETTTVTTRSDSRGS